MRYGFKLMSCKTGDHQSMIRRRQADSVGRAAGKRRSKIFGKRNDRSMIRRCQADSVHRAAGQRRSEIFRKKVENFSKYFPSALEDTSFTIYREGHGTSEMAKNVLSFFTGSDGLTRQLSV